MRVAGVIADAAPDAWGQRVILNRIAGAGAATTDPGDISLLTYLLESGSDRTGNLDFQASATEYVPRVRDQATLEELAHLPIGSSAASRCRRPSTRRCCTAAR